jgi:hypothetical protein
MYIEQLVALAEPADHIEDLASGIIEHRRDGALAEIEACAGLSDAPSTAGSGLVCENCPTLALC